MSAMRNPALVCAVGESVVMQPYDSLSAGSPPEIEDPENGEHRHVAGSKLVSVE